LKSVGPGHDRSRTEDELRASQFADRKGLPRELQQWVNRACQQLGIGHSRVHDFSTGYAQGLYERLMAARANTTSPLFDFVPIFVPNP
jgi:hypothetical protein